MDLLKDIFAGLGMFTFCVLGIAGLILAIGAVSLLMGPREEPARKLERLELRRLHPAQSQRESARMTLKEGVPMHVYGVSKERMN